MRGHRPEHLRCGIARVRGSVQLYQPMSTQVRPTHVMPDAPQAPGLDAPAWTVAEASQRAWGRVFVSLSPVIGQQGVAALYKRCLYLSRDEHPDLALLYERASPASVDLANLQGALSKLGADEAATVQAALGRCFAELLSQLIGAALAERLLHPLGELISPPLSGGPAAEDQSP